MTDTTDDIEDDPRIAAVIAEHAALHATPDSQRFEAGLLGEQDFAPMTLELRAKLDMAAARMRAAYRLVQAERELRDAQQAWMCLNPDARLDDDGSSIS